MVPFGDWAAALRLFITAMVARIRFVLSDPKLATLVWYPISDCAITNIFGEIEFVPSEYLKPTIYA